MIKIKFLSTLFILFAILFVFGCDQATKQNNTIQNADGVRKLLSDSSLTQEEIDGNLYHSIKYQFSIRFPEKWIFKKMLDPFIIFNMQKDSAKSFSLIKSPLGQVVISNTMSDKDIEDIKDENIQEMLALHYTVISDNLEKRLFHNVPALFSFSVIKGKLGDIENVEMVSSTYLFNLKDGTLVEFTGSTPAVFYNKSEQQRSESVFDSFKFDN
ncbi:MAG: hypothetical protein WDM71_02005 [Ferruginibacter sp.]